MVKAKKQPDNSRSVNKEEVSPVETSNLPVQEKQETPKPTTGQGPQRYESPNGFTIEDY